MSEPRRTSATSPWNLLRQAKKPWSALASRVHRHETDIVAIVGVACAGIAETNEETHVETSPRAEARLNPPPFPRPPPASSSSPSSSPRPRLLRSFLHNSRGTAIVAIVKSRSVMVGSTSSGSLTSLIFTASPISRPGRTSSIFSGIASAGQASSTSWRTTFRTPPRFRPALPSSSTKSPARSPRRGRHPPDA